MRKNLLHSLILVSTISGIYFSCSKGGDSDGGGYNPPPNPCAGVKGFKETGRKSVYIDDPCIAPCIALQVNHYVMPWI